MSPFSRYFFGLDLVLILVLILVLPALLWHFQSFIILIMSNKNQLIFQKKIQFDMFLYVYAV